MTEEEIKALQDAKEEAERRASEAEAAAQAARTEADKAKGDVDNVVNELKELRQKKGLAENDANINKQEPDVSSLVEQAIAAREQERRKTELEEAMSEFKSSKTEFQTDTAGIVYGKFEEALKKFNFSDVTNKSQAKARLEEVYRFVNGPNQEAGDSNYEGSPRTDGAVAVKDDGPSRDTQSAMEMAKIDEDKFTNLKSKYPDALASLGIE
jgi:DNA repair exonuclease SbcCD ATPase subunit